MRHGTGVNGQALFKLVPYFIANVTTHTGEPVAAAASSTQNSTLPYIHINVSNMPPTSGNSPIPPANEISKTPQTTTAPDPVRHQLSEALPVGHFPCFQDFKKKTDPPLGCAGWIQNSLPKVIGQINIVVCAEKACNFRIRAHWGKASEVVEESKPYSMYG